MRVKELSTINVFERLEAIQPMIVNRAIEKINGSSHWLFLGLQSHGSSLELRFEQIWQHETESHIVYLTVEEIEMDIDVWQEHIAKLREMEARQSLAKLADEKAKERMKKELEFERLRKELGK